MEEFSILDLIMGAGWVLLALWLWAALVDHALQAALEQIRGKYNK